MPSNVVASPLPRIDGSTAIDNISASSAALRDRTKPLSGPGVPMPSAMTDALARRLSNSAVAHGDAKAERCNSAHAEAAVALSGRQAMGVMALDTSGGWY